MRLKEDLVSIILPVYNAEKYLTECLESIKEQTYQNLQVIAIDDHSSDNSFAILRKYKQFIKGLEISRNKKRYGLAVCHNRAMKRVKGRFVAFMNPLDINAISRIKRQMSFLLKNAKIVAVGTQYTSINEDSKKLERSQLPEEHDTIYDTLLPTSSLHPETVMIDRTLIPKDLLYFKHAKYPFVFTEVFVKFFQYGRVANIGQSLYFHREGVKRIARRPSRMNFAKSLMKLLLTSRANHDYRPSLRTFFPQLVKGI